VVRRASLLVVFVLAGCPLPEDTFVLSGRFLPQGEPVAGAEVRLLRNRFASETRCDALEPLDVTRTDAEGRFTFSLVRQQITAGEESRRFFSVTADAADWNYEQRFWFPDADLDLGELGQLASATTIAEDLRLDGHLAWRSESNGPRFTPDRPFETRSVLTGLEWRTVPIDSLGRYDVVPVEVRRQRAWAVQQRFASAQPPGRGAACPFIDVKPCPLTDGRFLPYTFPPDTPALIFNFARETSVKDLLFHGLVLARPAVKARFDFNFFVDYTQWNPMTSARLDESLFTGGSCDEPGAFFNAAAGGFAKPVIFRVTFEDAAGLTVPIVSLQEMTVR
jgi:hypothetical protein